MRELIETVAKAAGAEVVIYDRESYQNMLMDYTANGRVICLIDEFGSLEKSFQGNGVITRMPIRVKFVKPTNLERTAIENETLMAQMAACFDAFIVGLVASGVFRVTFNFTLSKYQENMSDINAIGWTGSATLTINGGYGTC